MTNEDFEKRWAIIAQGKPGDEFSIFVPQGKRPQTQRQFNLYHYYQLINHLIAGRGYTRSIEFGCGRGTISLFLNLYNGFEVSLFDISEDGVNLARANFDLHGGRGNFFIADSAKVPVADHGFDLVVSIGLLEHLPDYPDILREMYRVLRPGGMMITMNVPRKTSIQVLNSAYRWLLRLFGRGPELRPDYFRVSDRAEDFKQKAEMVGFKECRIIHANPFPLFTPVPRPFEVALTALYREVMSLRQLYRPQGIVSGPRLSQCHFLIGYK